MMPHYGAAKAAVVNYTRSLGMAWGRKHVRVNCIAPGPIETEGYMGVLTKQVPAVAKKAYDTVASRVGMGRWGKVEEIAYPCIFLASDASSFMTGETIIVDGGPPPSSATGRQDAEKGPSAEVRRPSAAVPRNARDYRADESRLRGPDMAPHSRRASTPRVRPSGAASHLDLFEHPAGA